jgi:HEAT repeat protein
MMSEEKKEFPNKIARLLDHQDIEGLTVALRQSSDAVLRASAADAMAELGDTSATEMLVRSFLEDPDASVRASARRALTQLVGGQAEMAIAVYQTADRGAGQADVAREENWLIDSDDTDLDLDEAMEPGTEELDSTDLEGINRIALYEGDEKLRFQAIRVLSHSSDMRATDTLANLALWGDNRRLRAAARQALEDRYGEQSEQILNSYRNAIDDDISPDRRDDLGEDSYSDDLDDEYDDDFDDEDEQEDEEDETGELASDERSPYTILESSRPSGPIVEEEGLSWRIILLAVVGLAFLAAVLIFGRF